jgi:hypothetical protein
MANLSVFPRGNNINLSLFEPLKNFVNVGIGPLFFDQAYAVESGDTDARLLGVLLFLATRMIVVKWKNTIHLLQERVPIASSKTHGLGIS